MSACSTLNPTDAKKGSAENPFSMTQGIKFTLKNTVTRSLANGGGPFDLTGFTGRSQMRVDPLDRGTPIADFTVTITSATEGKAEITLDASLSVNFEPQLYVFDIEYIEGADPENIISGTNGVLYIQVLPAVTQP